MTFDRTNIWPEMKNSAEIRADNGQLGIDLCKSLLESKIGFSSFTALGLHKLALDDDLLIFKLLILGW